MGKYLTGRDATRLYNYSQNLKEAIRDSGMTHKELAKKMNMTVSKISQYTYGKQLPSKEVMEAFADALGYDVDYLCRIELDPGNDFDESELYKRED